MFADVGPLRYSIVQVPERFTDGDGNHYPATIDDDRCAIFISTLYSPAEQELATLEAIAEARQRLLLRWAALMPQLNAGAPAA